MGRSKNISQQELGRALKALRTGGGFSQEMAALVLRVPRTAIVGIETGHREVSALELLRLCRLYGRSPNEVLRWWHAHKT